MSWKEYIENHPCKAFIEDFFNFLKDGSNTDKLNWIMKYTDEEKIRFAERCYRNELKQGLWQNA